MLFLHDPIKPAIELTDNGPQRGVKGHERTRTVAVP
jgi:hypothetical protein